MLAKELIERPDGFLTATLNGKEYAIEDYHRAKTCANDDDSTLYWTLKLCDDDFTIQIKSKKEELCIHIR